MISELFTTKRAILLTLILLATTVVVQAQSPADLVKQLSGKADAPQRNAAQLTEAYQRAIDYLLPLMSAVDVESRYAPQIMFQDLGSHAARPGAESERVVLAKVLVKNLEQAKMPATVRNWFVLQLERIGKGESVPALAKLMASEDRHLRDFARRALEKNPDASATDVLLKELEKASEASWKIGLISSLGARGAEAAVSPIRAALYGSDPKIAAAAADALSKIISEESVGALFGVFEMPVSLLHLQAAQAVMDVTRELAQQGGTEGVESAGEICGVMYEGATQVARDSDEINPFSIRAAALYGMVVCTPEEGARELVWAIRDDDPKVRAAAAQAARHASSLAPTKALVGVLDDLKPGTQVQVLGVVADRGEGASVGAIKGLLASDDEAVRLATIDALTQLGGVEAAQVLFPVATSGAGKSKAAARAGLALIRGAGVEKMVNVRTASGNVDGRAVAISLLGQRHMPGAIDSLLVYAKDGDRTVSNAALKALPDVAQVSDIAAVADLVVGAKSDSARRGALSALRAVLGQAKDKDAAARIVGGKIRAAEVEAKGALLSSLNAVGGSMALRAIVASAQSDTEARRDVGIRTLSDWPDFEGTKALLEIAGNSETSQTHHVLAVRGALRLIATSRSAPMDERAALCFRVFDVARRSNEKKQAVAVMGSLPSKKVANRLLELVKDDGVKVEAGLAAVELASKTLRSDRAAAQKYAQKIRDLNISDEVNRRADAVIQGRRR